MNEANIIMVVVGFILGSIQYQIRVRLQDIKEDILRIMTHYQGLRAQDWSRSLSEAISIMRERLKMSKLDDKQREDYRNAIEEYDNMNRYLKITGIFVPLFLLIAYLLFKYISIILKIGGE